MEIRRLPADLESVINQPYVGASLLCQNLRLPSVDEINEETLEEKFDPVSKLACVCGALHRSAQFHASCSSISVLPFGEVMSVGCRLAVSGRLRAGPLVRVKAKFTVKNAVCKSLRRQQPAVLTVNLAFTLTSGPALMLHPCAQLETLQRHGITHVICVRQAEEAHFVRPNFPGIFQFVPPTEG